MNLAMKEVIIEEIQNLLIVGFIYTISNSEWVSLIVLVFLRTYGMIRYMYDCTSLALGLKTSFSFFSI